MGIEDSFSDQDQAASRFCERMLRQEPDASYKEVRREARNAAGLKLRREVWTSVRRQLGLRPDEEAPDAGDSEEGTSPPMSGPESRRHRDDAPPFRDDRPPRWDDRPQRTDRPPYPDRQPYPQRPPYREPAPPPAAREEPRYEGERRRPAWATPARGPIPPAPRMPEPRPFAQPPQPPAPVAPPPRSSTIVNAPRSAIEFMVEYLRAVNREASFNEVKDAAEREGYTVYPATFGRAQAIVGIVEAPVGAAARPIGPAAAAPVAPPSAPVVAAEVSATPAPTPVPAVAPAFVAPDPVEGLRAFFVAVDRLQSDGVRLRKAAATMLAAVQLALHPPK